VRQHLFSIARFWSVLAWPPSRSLENAPRGAGR
jgi:hypothetical protein